jgi:hypothetical protein
MRKLFAFLTIVVFYNSLKAQNYNRNKKCATDTVNVSHYDQKFGQHQNYRAFKCEQVSKLGIRFDLGFNLYNYNAKTKRWLGNHNGSTLGIGILYKDFTLSADFKPASITPKTELEFNGQLLTSQAKLNPIRIEYRLGYSINTANNFGIEPYIGYTRNSFRVINEEQLNKQYDIDKIPALTFGTTINKYFKIKGFQFIALWARYGYSFTNYEKINSLLGRGYNEFSFGLAYKGFTTRKFFDKIK